MTASLDPTNIAINNFGVAAKVARANVKGCTVGNVDIAPFDIEYGSGHKRIMTSNFKPSCFNTSDRASNRLSWATRRLTNPERRVRETMKEQVDPTTEAEATTGHLRICQIGDHFLRGST